MIWLAAAYAIVALAVFFITESVFRKKVRVKHPAIKAMLCSAVWPIFIADVIRINRRSNKEVYVGDYY